MLTGPESKILSSRVHGPLANLRRVLLQLTRVLWLFQLNKELQSGKVKIEELGRKGLLFDDLSQPGIKVATDFVQVCLSQWFVTLGQTSFGGIKLFCE